MLHAANQARAVPQRRCTDMCVKAVHISSRGVQLLSTDTLDRALPNQKTRGISTLFWNIQSRASHLQHHDGHMTTIRGKMHTALVMSSSSRGYLAALLLHNGFRGGGGGDLELVHLLRDLRHHFCVIPVALHGACDPPHALCSTLQELLLHNGASCILHCAFWDYIKVYRPVWHLGR